MQNVTQMLIYILTKPKYLLLLIASLIVYYIIFSNITLSSGPVVSQPMNVAYLTYLLTFTSAVLITVTVFLVNFNFANIKNDIYGSFSLVSTMLGGIVAGCGCQAPIIATIMYTLGLNTLSVSNVLYSVDNNQTLIFSLLILLNTFFIFYNTRQISSKCVIKNNSIYIKKRKHTGKK